MKKKSTSTPETSLTLVAAPIHAQALVAKKIAAPADLAGIAVALHKEIGLAFGRGLWLSAYCGKVLAELKRTLKHGQWLPFVQEHLEKNGLKERTIQNYMGIWGEAKARLLKSANVADLPDKPIDQYTSTDQQALVAGLQKICKGETARSLAGEVLEDAGIAKRPHGHALRGNAGGDKGGRRGKKSPEAEHAERKEWARSNLNTLLDELRDARDEKFWTLWPKDGPADQEKLTELADLVAELVHGFAPLCTHRKISVSVK